MLEQKALSQKAAQMVLCANIKEQKSPCMACKNCLKAQSSNHPDIILYGGEGGSKSFHIDIIREIKMSAYVKPNEADRKVYILENAQDMTPSAQNALLKLIEEPPDTCVFILTCDNKSKLLTTIISRVTIIGLDGVNEVSDEISGDISTIIGFISKGDSYECMKFLTKYERDRVAYVQLLAGLKEEISSEIRKIYSDNSGEQRLRALQAVKIIDIIDKATDFITQNVNGTLLTAYISSQFKNALAEG